MSNPQTQTQPAQTAVKTKPTAGPQPLSDFEKLLLHDIKTQVAFTPFGSEDEIKLSVPLIRAYIAVPHFNRETKDEVLPDDRECIRFLMLCRSRRLNPFEGDAFMVPFWDGKLGRPVWSLITAHSAFLKRAELHPEYDGMDSGVIVKDEAGNVVDREGDFTLPGDTLLGGWSIVYFKKRGHPKKSRVKLQTYQQQFGVWIKDPAGMICKVAEAGALRDSFPTMVGGLFLREEMKANGDLEETPAPHSEVKRPAFSGPAPGASLIPEKKDGQTTQKAAGASATSQTSAKTANAAPAPSSEAPQGNKTTAPSSRQPGGRASMVEQPVEKSAPPDDKPAENAGQPEQAADEAAEAAAGLAPEQQQQQPQEASSQDFTPDPKDSEAVQNIKFLAWQMGVTEAQIMVWAKSPDAKIAKPEQKTLSELATQKLVTMGKAIQNNMEEFKKRVLAANS